MPHVGDLVPMQREPTELTNGDPRDLTQADASPAMYMAEGTS